MRKIANTVELRAELESLVQSTREPNPSRERLASQLFALSLRVAGHDLAGADRSYPDGEGPATPWGPAQQVYDLVRGVRWVSCAGHGGLGVAKGVAQKMLTPAARRHGMLAGGYYWFEEDIAWTIPVFENPGWAFALTRHTGGKHPTPEYLEAQIRRWFPKYFEMSGLVDKPKLTPGMKIRCLNPLGYTAEVAAGSIWHVSKVTSSTFIAAKDGAYPIYRFRLNDYVNTDRWEVVA